MEPSDEMEPEQDEGITKEVTALVQESVIGKLPRLPHISAEIARAVVLTIPNHLLPKIIRGILERSVSDSGDKHLRAAKVCLGFVTEKMTYEQLWKVVEKSSEFEYGNSTKPAQDARPRERADEHYYIKAREQLLRLRELRYILAARELNVGTATTFRGTHLQPTINALENSIYGVLHDEVKMLEIANDYGLAKVVERLEAPDALSIVASQVLTSRDSQPFTVVQPSPTTPWQWSDVLDGSPLTPTHCANMDVISRRVLVDGEDRAESEFARWLASRLGKTILLSGQAGDGKTSYLNNLAVRSLETHVFLRWLPNAPFIVAEAEEYRRSLTTRLQSTASPVTPVVVVVYTLPNHPDPHTEQQLRSVLEAREHDGDGVAVLVDGRPGPLRRLSLLADTVKLAPPNEDEARAWIALLRSAHDQLVFSGFDDTRLRQKYPNLSNFLNLGDQLQIKLLTDKNSKGRSPLLVLLLRAVYGEKMWGKLAQELDRLGPADQKAYFHICLASLSGATLPTFALESMARGANLHERAKHDPWLRDEEGNHTARHPIIAQVVLEHCEDNGFFVRESLSAYAQLLRSGSPIYLELLEKIAVAARHMAPVATNKEYHDFHNRALEAVRDCVLSVDDLPQLVRSRVQDDYLSLFRWAETIVDLVPSSNEAVGRSDRSVLLRELAAKLFLAAESVSNGSNRNQACYRRINLSVRVGEILGKADPGFIVDQLEPLMAFVGESWCSDQFYIHLFFWSGRALESYGTQKLQGDDIELARVLYHSYFVAFQYLRLTGRPRSIESWSRTHTKMMTQFVSLHIPDHAPELVRQAWEKSVALGNPDVGAMTLYSESLLDAISEGASRRFRETLKQGAGIADAVSRAEPSLGEPLFLLALFGERNSVGMPEDLRDRVEHAVESKPNDLNRAYLDHARAILATESQEKIKLLSYAIKKYAAHAKSWEFGFERVEFAWRHAWGHIRKAGDKNWVAHRKQYERTKRQGWVADN